jgi:hypothetical protein
MSLVIAPAQTCSERYVKLANNAYGGLVGIGYWYILSNRFYCLPLCGVLMNHEKWGFLFFVFKNVDRANVANIKAPPLLQLH